jgi:hypothetical protein
MSEPSTTEGCKLHNKEKVLIEQAIVQQADSSASRMHSAVSKADGAAHQGRGASVHTPLGGKGKAAAVDDARAPWVHDHIKKPLVRECLYDA